MNYIKSKCDVCGNEIEIDKYGNGNDCPVCGWRQSEEAFNHKNTAGIRNIPSLNNAIQQYKKGQSATLANFSDFIQAMENYGELEFTYKNIRYGVLYDDKNKNIVLLNIKTNQKKYFTNIFDFSERAEINNIKLKTLWENVTDTDFLQDS